jgi:hypothetical protein
MASTAVAAGPGAREGDSEETVRSFWTLSLPAKINFVNPADAFRVAAAGERLLTQAIVTDASGIAVANATVRWNVDRDPFPEGADVEGDVGLSEDDF